MRGAAAGLVASTVLGAAANVAICWLGAWDLSVPAPQLGGMIGQGPSFHEPTLLRWYRALVPREASAQWAYEPDFALLGEESARTPFPDAFTTPAQDDNPSIPSTEDSGSSFESTAGYFIAAGALMRFEIGQGLYDRLIATTATHENPADGSIERRADVELGAWMRLELDREVSEPHDFSLQTPCSDQLGPRAFGVKPLVLGDSEIWRGDFVHASETAESLAPPTMQGLEPDSQIWRMIGFGQSSRRITEIRLYGWPLRCMSVRGIRTQRWTSSDAAHDDQINVLQDDHWTDALLGFEPHPSWSFDADRPPATGLPWKPLWLPFLANSLILGVPLTLAGFGVSRAARAGLAKFRGQSDRCPRCGYPRKGLARGAACPECGGG